jgi:hypothetical protein
MRDTNGDGLADNEEIEVLDAFKKYKETMIINSETFSTSGLTTSWNGDFAVFTSETELPPASSHRKEFYVPKGTTTVFAELEYNAIAPSIFCPTSSILRLALDADGDGNYEETDIDEQEITIEGGTDEGSWWAVDVQGTSIGSCLTGGNLGPRAAYDVEINIRFNPTQINLDINQSRGWIPLGDGVAEITMQKLQYIHPSFEEEEEQLSGLDGMIKWLQVNWWIPLIITAIIIIASILMNERTQNLIKELIQKENSNNFRNVEIVEKTPQNIINAEIMEAELL